MENPHPGALFERTFVPAINGSLMSAIRRAYDTACEHYVPEHGSDETTFGFNLYAHAVHELAREAKRYPDVLVVASTKPRFRISASEYTLACHRVGRSEKQDIRSSFPQNDGAAPAMVEEQLWLDGAGFKPEINVKKARNLILAHLGNPEEGLRAVYLCIPDKTDKGRISSWAFTYLIWRADDEAGTVRQNDNAGLPPEVKVDAPAVVRKPKRDRDETGASEPPPEENTKPPSLSRKPNKGEGNEENG